MNKQIDLSIIIVNFNGKRLLKACLESIYAETVGLQFEIFVVDNNSSDGSQEMIKEKFTNVTLIENSENVGFAKANNQAFLLGVGQYVMLLNPDTVILPSAISNLMSFLNHHPETGIVGPKLLNSDGSTQFSLRMNFPSLTNQLFESLMLQRFFPKLTPFFGEIVNDDKYYECTRSVAWLGGAALMVRKSLIDSIGFLDERFFMYSEEKDWCYRAFKQGWMIQFNPDAKIIHHQGKWSVNEKSLIQLHNSTLLFFQKYNGRLKTFLLRGILAIGNLIRAFLWLIMRFSGDAKNAERSYIYWQGFCFCMGLRSKWI